MYEQQGNGALNDFLATLPSWCSSSPFQALSSLSSAPKCSFLSHHAARKVGGLWWWLPVCGSHPMCGLSRWLRPTISVTMAWGDSMDTGLWGSSVAKEQQTATGCRAVRGGESGWLRFGEGREQLLLGNCSQNLAQQGTKSMGLMAPKQHRCPSIFPAIHLSIHPQTAHSLHHCPSPIRTAPGSVPHSPPQVPPRHGKLQAHIPSACLSFPTVRMLIAHLGCAHHSWGLHAAQIKGDHENWRENERYESLPPLAPSILLSSPPEKPKGNTHFPSSALQ